MASSTLDAIRTKVRRLTRNPSESSLTTTQLDEYINTFVLYDFPEHLRLFNLKTTFTFYTEPYIDVYETNTTNVDSPLYDFKNKYISIDQPIFVAGFQVWFSEDRTRFFGQYPLVNSIASIGTAGDGVTTTFTGVVSAAQANIPPSLQAGPAGTILLLNNVLFSSVDINNSGLAAKDVPSDPFDGTGDLVDVNTNTVIGSIDYLTGAFSITFPTAPAAGAAINSQTVPVQPSLPQALLFYDGKFTMRPVPDQPYAVTMNAFIRPTELLTANQEPQLQEWWQYIAYGAAKKVFEDKMDVESVQLIMPEFKMQEMLIQRRTIVQQTSQRTSTIYTDQTMLGGSWGNGYWGGSGNF